MDKSRIKNVFTFIKLKWGYNLTFVAKLNVCILNSWNISLKASISEIFMIKQSRLKSSYFL